MKLSLYIVISSMLVGCVTMKEPAYIYFRYNDSPGVEPPDEVVSRFTRVTPVGKLFYGKDPKGLMKCTLLRHQLYMAELRGISLAASIKDAAQILERGYQDNDEHFLQACDRVLTMSFSGDFVAAQTEELLKK